MPRPQASTNKSLSRRTSGSGKDCSRLPSDSSIKKVTLLPPLHVLFSQPAALTSGTMQDRASQGWSQNSSAPHAAEDTNLGGLSRLPVVSTAVRRLCAWGQRERGSFMSSLQLK